MGVSKKIDSSDNLGIVYGLSAFFIWGMLPLYWKLLQSVPAFEILTHRFLWSFVFMAFIVSFTGGFRSLLAVIKDRKKLLTMFLCGFVISLNWYTFIYAVTSDFVIEASMGYYINPLVVVMLGVLVFKERLNSWQIAAFILAAIGVVLITIQYGRIPWIAFTLAATFSFYGMLKKKAQVDPATGLILETAVITPIALFFIYTWESSGTGAFMGAAMPIPLFLMGAGIVTATPLLLYARGVEKTAFSMMGFLQYITPTANLLLGVFVFKEDFSLLHFFSFCFIWAALIIFTLARIGILKSDRPDIAVSLQKR